MKNLARRDSPWWKQALGVFLVTLLSVSLLACTLPGVASAAPGHGKGKAPGWSDKWRFADEDRVGWGHEYMAKMKGKGIIKGYPGNQFGPENSVTYAEAVTMAVRLMGLETQAQQRTQAQLRFANAPEVLREAGWARGYLDVAGNNGLIPVRGAFRPNAPADRLWVAVLLVKAAGLEAEAEANMGATLPFADSHLIPADLVGYVAVALQQGFITGYEDRTFRPLQPVKRLEMAALLDRADFWLPPRSEYQVKGTIVATDAEESTITLDVYRWHWWPWPPWWPVRPPWPPIYRPAESEAELDAQAGVEADAKMVPIPGPIVERRTYNVSDDALILLDHKPATLDELPAKAVASLVLNTEKVAVVIDARTGYHLPEPPPVQQEVEGTVQARTENEITLKLENGKQATYRLAENVRVYYEGEAVPVSQIRVGDQVQLRLKDGLVIRVRIEEREHEYEEFEGTISAITTGDDDTVTLTVYNDDDDVLKAEVAANAEITYDDEPLPLEELRVGDKVELELEDGVIVKVTVTEREETTVTGTVRTVTRSENRWTITLRDSAGNTLTYSVSKRVEIRFQGEKVGIAELETGDLVRVKVAGGLIYRIDIQARGS